MTEKIPSKKWINKVLKAKQDIYLPIIKGSFMYNAEIKKDQLVRVIGVQSGNWLQVILLDNVNFKEDAGLSGLEIDNIRKYNSNELILALSLNFHIKKFKVVK